MQSWECTSLLTGRWKGLTAAGRRKKKMAESEVAKRGVMCKLSLFSPLSSITSLFSLCPLY